MLTLENPIEFNERVAPICMDSTGVKLGEIVIVAGWGSITSEDCYGDGPVGDTTILHQGHMHVVHRGECEIQYVMMPLNICI